VPKHILENDRAALKCRQPQKGLKAGDGHVVALLRGIFGDNHVEILRGLSDRRSRMATQMIERRVVGDTEQPAGGIVDRAHLRERIDRLDHRVLDDVFSMAAVCHVAADRIE
jgi:hypothetical protein